jgi:hypothetical protein
MFENHSISAFPIVSSNTQSFRERIQLWQWSGDVEAQRQILFISADARSELIDYPMHASHSSQLSTGELSFLEKFTKWFSRVFYQPLQNVDNFAGRQALVFNLVLYHGGHDVTILECILILCSSASMTAEDYATKILESIA